jgi:hypothetical protein
MISPAQTFYKSRSQKKSYLINKKIKTPGISFPGLIKKENETYKQCRFLSH